MQHILIIDDEPTFLDTFTPLLTKEGYRVTTASGGEEGLKKIREDSPDLILLDIGMPGMDGMDFLRTLRTQRAEESKEIPVLILTNFTDMEKVSQGVEYGVRGYMVKVLEDLDGVAKRIRDVLIEEEIREKEQNG